MNADFGTISAMFPRSDKSIDYISRYTKSQYIAAKHQIKNAEARRDRLSTNT